MSKVIDDCPFCGGEILEGQTACVCGSYTRQYYDTASRMRTNPRASRTPHVEHAFRQHPPSKYARFTSSSVDPHGPQSGLSDKGVRFIFGWPKDGSRGKSTSEVQSVKFRADQWTIPQAKKWLREHGYKHDKYEKAQPMRKNPHQMHPHRRSNPHRPGLPGEFTKAQLDELVREQGGSYATPEVVKAADMFEDDVRAATRHWDEDMRPGPVAVFDAMAREEGWVREAPDHLWASYDRLVEEIEAAGESTARE